MTFARGLAVCSWGGVALCGRGRGAGAVTDWERLRNGGRLGGEAPGRRDCHADRAERSAHRRERRERRLPLLEPFPGKYSVTVERPGFASARRDVSVALGNVVLSITLQVAGVEESLIVEGGGPDLDSREVQTGATFGRRELDSIPTTRDPWAILQQVPGVLLVNIHVGGDATAHQGSFSGKATPSGQNSYNLGGAAISLGGITPMFFDWDSLDTIEVTTGGSDLALASPGVALNLVTKRGTNELKGSARGLYTGGAGWDYGVEVGGPLWRDRVWLWGAFAHNAYIGQPFLNKADEPLLSQDRVEEWNAKLNARPVPANALTLSFIQFHRTFVGWQTGRDQSAESSLTNLHPAQSYKVEDAHVFSAKLFGSAYFSYLPASSEDFPVGGPDEQADVDSTRILRHSILTRFIRDDKHQTGLNASTFFNTGVLRHEVKLGLGYWHVRFDSFRQWPGDELVGDVRPEPVPRSRNHASAERQVPGQPLRRLRRRHDPGWETHGQRRREIRLPAGTEPSLLGSGQPCVPRASAGHSVPG